MREVAAFEGRPTVRLTRASGKRAGRAPGGAAAVTASAEDIEAWRDSEGAPVQNDFCGEHADISSEAQERVLPLCDTFRTGWPR